MAKPERKTENIQSLLKRILALEARAAKAEEKHDVLYARVFRTKGQTLNKEHAHTGEKAQAPEDDRTHITDADKLQCVINAVRILPPNYMVDGRHTGVNVSAICGFPVTEEMLDMVYDKAEEG
jgi:hypothetical protein